MRTILLVLALCISTTALADPTTKKWSIRSFKKYEACPSTGKIERSCPGWVVDHKCPKVCGGEDHPRNLKWVSIEDAYDPNDKHRCKELCGKKGRK